MAIHQSISTCRIPINDQNHIEAPSNIYLVNYRGHGWVPDHREEMSYQTQVRTHPIESVNLIPTLSTNAKHSLKLTCIFCIFRAIFFTISTCVVISSFIQK